MPLLKNVRKDYEKKKEIEKNIDNNLIISQYYLKTEGNDIILPNIINGNNNKVLLTGENNKKLSI